MTIAIIFLVIGVIVNIFIVKWQRKEAEMPFIPEWKFDENVTAAEEGLFTTMRKQESLKTPAKCNLA